MAKIRLSTGATITAPDGLDKSAYDEIVEDAYKRTTEGTGGVTDVAKYMGAGLAGSALEAPTLIPKYLISKAKPFLDKTFNVPSEVSDAVLNKVLRLPGADKMQQVRSTAEMKLKGAPLEFTTKSFAPQAEFEKGMKILGADLRDQPETPGVSFRTLQAATQMKKQGMTDEQILAKLDLQKTWLKNKLKSGVLGVSKFAETLFTPENAVLAGTFGGISKLGKLFPALKPVTSTASRTTAATFAPGMITGTAEEVERAIKAKTPAERDEAAVNATLTGILAGGLSKGAFGSSKGKAVRPAEPGMTDANIVALLEKRQAEAKLNQDARTFAEANKPRLNLTPLLPERTATAANLEGKTVVVGPSGKVEQIKNTGDLARPRKAVDPNMATVTPKSLAVTEGPVRGTILSVPAVNESGKPLSREQIGRVINRTPFRGKVDLSEGIPEVDKGQVQTINIPVKNPSAKIEVPKIYTSSRGRDVIHNIPYREKMPLMLEAPKSSMLPEFPQLVIPGTETQLQTPIQRTRIPVSREVVGSVKGLSAKEQAARIIKGQAGAVGDVTALNERLAQAKRIREYATRNGLTLDEAIKRVAMDETVLDKTETPRAVQRLTLPVDAPRLTIPGGPLVEDKAYAASIKRHEEFSKDYKQMAKKSAEFTELQESGQADPSVSFMGTPEYQAFSSKFPEVPEMSFRNADLELKKAQTEFYKSALTERGLETKPHLGLVSRDTGWRQRTDTDQFLADTYKSTDIQEVPESFFNIESGKSKASWKIDELTKEADPLVKRAKKSGLSPEKTSELLEYVTSDKPGAEPHFDPRARAGENYSIPEYKGPTPSTEQLNALIDLRKFLDKMFLESGQTKYLQGYVPWADLIPEHMFSGQKSILDPAIHRKRSGKNVPKERNIDKLLNRYIRQHSLAMFPEIRQGLAQAQLAKWKLEARGYTDVAETLASRVNHEFGFKTPKDMSKVDMTQFNKDMTLSQIKAEMKAQGLSKAFIDEFIDAANEQFVGATIGLSWRNMIGQTMQRFTSGGPEVGLARIIKKQITKRFSKADQLELDAVRHELREKRHNILETDEPRMTGKIGKALKLPGKPAMAYTDMVDMGGREVVHLAAREQFLEAKNPRSIMEDITKMERDHVLSTYNTLGKEAAARQYGILRSRRVNNRYTALNKPEAFRTGIGRWSVFTTYGRGETSKVVRDLMNIKNPAHRKVAMKRLVYPVALGATIAAATGDPKWLWYFSPYAAIPRMLDTSLGAPQALVEGVSGAYGNSSPKQVVKGVADMTASTKLLGKLLIPSGRQSSGKPTKRGGSRGGTRQ